LLVFSIFALGMGFIALVVNGGDSAAGPRVGVVNLSGAITDEGEGGGLSRSPGARDVIEDLDRAGRDTTIKAVVLRINSPGGSPAASQEMYRAVKKLAEKKPVICSMGDVAASGGYYVAAACDEIYANESTVTGSIGVISQYLNYSALAKKLGIETQTLKTGEFKDAGNPTRPITPRERELFQSLLRDIYNQFVDDVMAGRKGKSKKLTTRAQVVKLADGRVYTGRQAFNNGLIDKLGGLREAVNTAAERVGLEGSAPVKNYGGGGGLGSLFGAQSEQSMQSVAQSVAASAGDAAGRAFVERVRAEAQTDARAAAPQLR
jgi:protease-4